MVGGVAAALVFSGVARVLAADEGEGDGRATQAQTARGEPSLAATGAPGREAATAALLRDLGPALREGDVRAARALAGPPAARGLGAVIARNVTRLGVEGVRLRRLAEAAAPADLVHRFGAETWVAEVRLSWRYAGIDDRPVSSTVRLVLTPTEDGAALAAVRPSAGEQAPTWVLGPLVVHRRDRVQVAAPEPTVAAELLTLASRAASVVARRLPGWHGELVVEAPGSASHFRAATGVPAAAANSIAAVTTTADGSTLPGSPERVFVNPRVFEPLGAPGQQIVLSHEATHVAVDAAVSPVPAWLSEGFADWVALADSRVPVRVLASQALDVVRVRGAPARLPGRAAFGAADPHLGAAYESAWLAVRLIARSYGEPALLRFQRVADRRGSVDRAFRTALGTSQAAFTAAWRRHLVRLAG